MREPNVELLIMIIVFLFNAQTCFLMQCKRKRHGGARVGCWVLDASAGPGIFHPARAIRNYEIGIGEARERGRWGSGWGGGAKLDRKVLKEFGSAEKGERRERTGRVPGLSATLVRFGWPTDPKSGGAGAISEGGRGEGGGVRKQSGSQGGRGHG